MVPNQGAENDASGSATPLPVDIFKPDNKSGLAPIEQTAIERLQRLIQDCGYSSERLRDMYYELPPRKLRDDLIDYYFSTMFVVPYTSVSRC